MKTKELSQFEGTPKESYAIRLLRGPPSLREAKEIASNVIPNLRFTCNFFGNRTRVQEGRANCPAFFFATRLRLLPKCPNGYGKEPVAEANRALSVIEHHARDEPLPRCFSQLSQAAKIGPGHRRRRLDLNAGHVPCALLQHDVHFYSILVPEVEEIDGSVGPTDLPPNLLEHEGLQQPSEGLAILGESLGIDSEQDACLREDEDKACQAPVSLRLIEMLWSGRLKGSGSANRNPTPSSE